MTDELWEGTRRVSTQTHVSLKVKNVIAITHYVNALLTSYMWMFPEASSLKDTKSRRELYPIPHKYAALIYPRPQIRGDTSAPLCFAVINNVSTAARRCLSGRPNLLLLPTPSPSPRWCHFLFVALAAERKRLRREKREPLFSQFPWTESHHIPFSPLSLLFLPTELLSLSPPTALFLLLPQPLLHLTISLPPPPSIFPCSSLAPTFSSCCSAQPCESLFHFPASPSLLFRHTSAVFPRKCFI